MKNIQLSTAASRSSAPGRMPPAGRPALAGGGAPPPLTPAALAGMTMAGVGPRPVSFAVPFDLRCGVCGSGVECGTCLSATKCVAGVSAGGIVTWHFAMACPSPTCTASVELRSHPAALSRFTPHGTTAHAQRPEPPPAAGRPPPSDATSAGVARGTEVAPRLRTRSDAQRARDVSEFEALRRQRRAAHADVAATAEALLARHKARWDATPLRTVARDAVAVGEIRKKAARRVSRLARTGAAAPLAAQRAKTARMEGGKFAAARRAVRRLHRNGALKRVLSAAAKASQRAGAAAASGRM